ncbi:formylglycine-generating enzyme family protein [Oscillochloris sp. ZM17-4]|uniref:formylglycine-generating enzyme family protein n=1 Tax=Oscillochloris sp. ZM17-4 TaxID=2866714 RepID=UPI001C72A56E|nr:SUMF1/EgtB/PvdO family nonheme iron enzyme [Oscillochloris sp. ZM17-4]MBX0331536.1 formylglycine-generating enzyme family protein [Oscillochloris sp. ZM17-4]
MGAAEVERELRAALPAEAQAQAPGLARLLSELADGTIRPEALGTRLAADPALAALLRSLVGQQINLGATALSFWEGSQVGDVSIRDVAGRDIITVNVYHGAPTAAPLPDVPAPNPTIPTLTPADIERIWRRALSAYLQRRWQQAEPLLAAIAAAAPGHRDVQARLAEARRQLGLLARYADLRALRDAGDWHAVLGGLAELDAAQPGHPDPQSLRGWAAARQRREGRYDAALAAADAGDWATAADALEALLAEAPGDAEAEELLGHARGELRARREAEERRRAQELRRQRRTMLAEIVDLLKAGRHDDALARLANVAADPAMRENAAAYAARLAETAELPFAARLPFAQLAGTLGDPRSPAAPDAWRRELGRRGERFGPQPWGDMPPPYWCYVPGGTYRIGGWEKDQASADIALPAFWVGRLPITVIEYAAFVSAGGKRPYRWGQAPYDAPSQPVIGITWEHATAYCAWLSERLADALPAGYVLRLPTEAEWEVAAAYDGAKNRHRFPWGEDEPTSERAVYDASRLKHPAPVGCCPSGAAACGALDMAGNVWEVATSSSKGYPTLSGEVKKDFTHDYISWRGGSWYFSSLYVRCGARVGYLIRGRGDLDFGFRVVLAPPLLS